MLRLNLSILIICSSFLSKAQIEKTIQLQNVDVEAGKLVPKKYGIRNRNTLMHFTDGMFLKDSTFEIAQLVKLGKKQAQITSINLYIAADRDSSASFKVNFYGYDQEQQRPAERLTDEIIIQKHPIKKGWMSMSLTSHELTFKGDFIIALELVSEGRIINPIHYEIRLGGLCKSFYRRGEGESWNRPPHHYCMYVTAMVDKNTPEEPEYLESRPAFYLKSEVIGDTYSLFVRLPEDYHETSSNRYPVLYLLDGNVYFSQVEDIVKQFKRKNQIRIEPIVVGIGYDNAYVMDSLRVRDYTFPKAMPNDSFSISGGGMDFYNFLKDELIPLVDKTYRTQVTDRAIAGHSFGGYFTLFALSQFDSPFNGYLAASPSLSYGHGYLLERASQLGNQVNTKLYLTDGGKDRGENGEDNMNQLERSLQNKEIDVNLKLYIKMDHMGVAVPSFADGIMFLYQ